MRRLPPRSTLTDTLFPYTTLCRSDRAIGVGDVLKRGTTEDALAERGAHRAALHDRAHFHAAGRATILPDHDTVLRHVDQAAGQITRVRRLERRVGPALACAGGRVARIMGGQAFLDLRGDLRLAVLARRLGPQASHTP